MNLFAHYYFHHRPGNCTYNAGLLFPDLLRMLTLNQRVGLNKLQNSISKIHSENLISGIVQHFEADHQFHNWAWFIEKNKQLTQSIRNEGLNIKRDWFLAHIMIELAIDHVLVCQNKPMVAKLYSDLGACEHQWDLFFKNQGFSELRLWTVGLHKFRASEYIFSYKDTDNVIYALNRIYQNAGIGTLSDIQTKFLVVILNNLIPEIKSKLNELQKILT